MQPFELITAICSAIAVLSATRRFERSYPRISLGFVVCACISLALHFYRESIYWQVLPLYAGFAIAVATVICAQWSRSCRLHLWAASSLLFVVSSVFCSLLLPIYPFMKPTGVYPVGTQLIHLVTDRREPHLASTDARRELMIQVWYPAASATGTRARYRRPGETTPRSSYQILLQTPAFLHAPVAITGRRFPVVLFNHAWNGYRTQNTYEMTELASHGYVVVAIDHTYNCEAAVFPDGHVIACRSLKSIDDFSQSSLEQQVRAGDEEVRIQAEDNSLVLDALERWNASSGNAFFNSLDLTRVAAIGHSFGGAVSIQAAIQEPRVKAAVNMDGWIFGDFATAGLNKPMLLLYEDNSPVPESALDVKDTAIRDYNCMEALDREHVEQSLLNYGGYEFFIHGARHSDFTDSSLRPRLSYSKSGSVSKREVLQIVNAYTLAFLDYVLKSERSSLLESNTSPFKSVTFQSWPGGYRIWKEKSFVAQRCPLTASAPR